MYIKPLHIYKFDKLNSNKNIGNASYEKYIITNNSKDLFNCVYMLDEFYPFCLTHEVAKHYLPEIYKGRLSRVTNTFLDLRKLTYEETIRYINLEVFCEYDGVIKNLINKIILYWDDWN